MFITHQHSEYLENMENWALALICALMVLAGAVAGGLAVYIFGRMRRRRQQLQRRGPGVARRPAADLCMEEFETQMTEAEKQVLRNIASADGAISLTLKLPDSSLCMSITNDDGSLVYAGDASHSTLPPAIPAEAVEHEVPVPGVVGTNGHSQHGVCSSNDVPIAVVCADPPLPGRRSLMVPGVPLMCPARHTDDLTCISASEPCYSHNSGTHLPSASLVAMSQPPATAPAAPFALSAATEWTSPAADRRSRQLSVQATVVGDELVECEDTIEEIPDQKADDTDDADFEVLCSPKRAPYSLIDRHIESFRYNESNAPSSPQTLASPCGSSDYEFVPPSPSISSLYEVPGPDTALLQPSALLANPRTTGLGKSVDSPSGLTGSSLFSPPPVSYHQRYFEAHGMRVAGDRNSGDKSAD
ncbi:hypothetical protein GGI20_003836 [Coemansia sp. BCRC 34301]|nr:hypothetical protein GGI20_003836 [Coemansia sp. BCRC 34301]